jgi:hypothetical protein
MLATVSGLLPFLGGTAFRWIFGELFSYLKARQEHKQELELRHLERDIAKDNAIERRLEIKAAAEAGVQIIQAQREATHENMLDKMLSSAVEGVDKLSGIPFVDGANKLVRPTVAYTALLMLVLESFFPTHVVLKAATVELFMAFLGLFCGGRISSTGR